MSNWRAAAVLWQRHPWCQSGSQNFWPMERGILGDNRRGLVAGVQPGDWKYRVSRLVVPHFWRALLDYCSWSAQPGYFVVAAWSTLRSQWLVRLGALVLIPLPVHHTIGISAPRLAYNFQMGLYICLDVSSRSTFWPIASPRYIGRRNQNKFRHVWLDRMPLLKPSVPATLCSLGLRVPITVGLWDVCPTSNWNELGDL